MAPLLATYLHVLTCRLFGLVTTVTGGGQSEDEIVRRVTVTGSLTSPLPDTVLPLHTTGASGLPPNIATASGPETTLTIVGVEIFFT